VETSDPPPHGDLEGFEVTVIEPTAEAKERRLCRRPQFGRGGRPAVSRLIKIDEQAMEEVALDVFHTVSRSGVRK
jgi:hypothetical protein